MGDRCDTAVRGILVIEIVDHVLKLEITHFPHLLEQAYSEKSQELHNSITLWSCDHKVVLLDRSRTAILTKRA